MAGEPVVDVAPQTCIREIPRAVGREVFVTAAAAPGPELEGLAAALRADHAATVMAGEYFGPNVAAADLPATAATLAASPVPVTWVLGNSATPGLGGLHLWAAAGADVEPIVLDGRILGAVLRGPYADECWLAGLHAADTSASLPDQARATYELMEQALGVVGMDFSHVARTWLFLHDILSWYGPFNKVRTDFFTERGVFDRLVPASTGIGGSNPAGAAMITGVYALRPKHPSVTVQAVPSPLQCPALAYGSSFSRAVEVALPDVKRLWISGTASIAPDGETQHLDDVVAQTALTCDVVAAILKSRGMDWADVTRATAYFRHAADAGIFAQHCAAAGLPPLPTVVAHNVICRDNLLFELEVDAVQAQSG